MVGFWVCPYIMDVFNNKLIAENQALQDRIVQLEQQLSKPSPPIKSDSQNRQIFNGVEMTLLSCDKVRRVVSCQFTIKQSHDFFSIYAYGSVLKLENNVIGYAEAVEATGYDVSVLKTEQGEISSWKLLTVPFTVSFRMSSDVTAIENGSIELFVKFDQKPATTIRFAQVNIEVSQ